VVFEPLRYFSASLDLWNINRSDSIQTLSLRQLVDNFSVFQDRFIRDSSGRLIAIDQTWLNTGGSKTRGVEIALRGGGDVLGGRVLGGIDGTWQLKKKEQVVEGGDFDQRLGVFSFSGDLGLRWKHNAFVSYGQDRWTLALTQIFRSGYKNQQLPGVESGEIDPPNDEKRVNRYVIYNLSAAFEVNERMRFTAGVRNLFDKDPPFAITYDSNTGAGSSWEPRVADPRGRAFTMMADVKF
jgi:iron complex outermembrane receptor protein